MGRRRTPIVFGGTPRTLHAALPAATLDLHGFDRERAERRLESFLRAESGRNRGKVVEVITGRGARSEGPAILREAVREALTGGLSDFVDEWSVSPGGGAYLVRLAR
jgi:DNA-nicking Smr family endonuclease